jgi:hypothetical protein
MLINDKKHKQQLRNSFKGLLATNGMKLSDFCIANNLHYMQTYQTLFRYANIDLVKLNELISLVDQKKKAQFICEKWVISAKF